MANDKQSKSVVTGSTRVLRPRRPTIEYSNVDERGRLKIAEASGKLKVGNAGKSDIDMKRKIIADEGAGIRAKKVKDRDKNKMDQGAASGSTRVLRSRSAKQEIVQECARAKTRKEVVEAKMKSAGKGSCSLAADFTGPESTGKRVTRSATKDRVVVQASTLTRKNTMRKNQAAAKTK